MASADKQREGAQVWKGDEVCSQKVVSLLRSHGLPDGLFPVPDIQEVGFVESTGFFWLTQRKSSEHVFKAINSRCSHAKDMSCIFQKQSIKKLKGVKARELLLWIPVAELFTDDAHPDQVYVKSAAGVGQWQPFNAFCLQQQ